MSDTTNEIGRAVEDSAPVDVLSHADRSSDVYDDAPALCPDKPSLPEPSALDAHASASHQFIPLDGKVPTERAWPKAKPLNLANAKARMQAGKNVGVRLGASDLVVDVDPRAFEDGDGPFARLKADFALPDAPFVRTGGGGWHFYFRKPAEVAVVNALAGYKGVEFKSLGRQVVAAGSIHPDTGEPYRLDVDPLAMSLSEAPDATTALLDAIRKPIIEASSDKPGEITPDQLERLLSKLDIHAFNHRHDDWLRIMMASHHGTGGLGSDEFVAWSVSDPDYADDEPDIRRRWRTLNDKPDGVKLGSLLKAFSDAGHGAWVEEVLRVPAVEDFDDDLVAEGAQKRPRPVRITNDWVWVADASQFVRRDDCKKYTADQWKSMFANLKPEGDVLSAVWKGNISIRKFESLIYLPCAGEFPDGEFGSRYNIWRESGVVPRAGDVAPFLEHMAYLFPGKADRNHVLDYLALLVQRPADKVHFALLIRGAQGTGKSWVGRLMERVVGARNVVRPSNDEVTSKWTAWMEGAQLAIIEELMTLGRREVANRLKPVITDTTLRIEDKGCKIYTIPNHLNLICFTNHDDALPIEHGDRRWLVVFSPAAKKDDAYYERLFAYLDGDGASAVKHWLAHRHVALNPRSVAPETTGKDAMRRLSLGDAESYLMELLDEGGWPFDFDLVRLDEVVTAVPLALRGRSNLRARVSKFLKEEAKAIMHNRYTKGDKRPAYQLWSIRNHDHWEQVGASGRIDAFLEHQHCKDDQA